MIWSFRCYKKKIS